MNNSFFKTTLTEEWPGLIFTHYPWAATDSLKDWLTWADPCRGIGLGDKRWRISFLARCPIPRLKAVESLMMTHHFPTSVLTRRNLHESNDLSHSQKELYQELVVGSASDLLVVRLGKSLEEIHSQWNLVPG